MANRKITPKEFRQRVAEWAASDDGLAYEAKLEDEAANRALRRDLEADVLTLANRIYYRKYISDEERYRAALDRHERWRKENPERFAEYQRQYKTQDDAQHVHAGASSWDRGGCDEGAAPRPGAAPTRKCLFDVDQATATLLRRPGGRPRRRPRRPATAPPENKDSM